MADFLISLLSIYFPPLLPHGSADLEVTHSIQTAALVGIGLLYLGSAHRHMVEVALRQIGHAPGPELEFATDRESYSLAAGFALGMITLGVSDEWWCFKLYLTLSLSLSQRGGNCVGLSDLHLVDQLCVYMNGGPKSLVAMEMASGTSQLVLVSKIPIIICINLKIGNSLYIFPGRRSCELSCDCSWRHHCSGPHVPQDQ